MLSLPIALARISPYTQSIQSTPIHFVLIFPRCRWYFSALFDFSCTSERTQKETQPDVKRTGLPLCAFQTECIAVDCYKRDDLMRNSIPLWINCVPVNKIMTKAHRFFISLRRFAVRPQSIDAVPKCGISANSNNQIIGLLYTVWPM